MTTVINNPGGAEGSDSSSGFSVIIGVILLLVVIGLFFIYALPAIRNNPTAATPQNSSIDVNVKLPAGGTTPAPTSAQ